MDTTKNQTGHEVASTQVSRHGHTVRCECGHRAVGSTPAFAAAAHDQHVAKEAQR